MQAGLDGPMIIVRDVGASRGNGVLVNDTYVACLACMHSHALDSKRPHLLCGDWQSSLILICYTLLALSTARYFGVNYRTPASSCSFIRACLLYEEVLCEELDALQRSQRRKFLSQRSLD